MKRYIAMKKKSLWLLPFLLLISTLVGCASSDLLSDIDLGVAGDGTLNRVLEPIRDDHGLPSLAAVLIRSGEIVETGAVGVRAAGSSVLVTTGDRWHLGSITKAMTATLAATLVEQGVIEWSTTVEEVFPDLVGNIRSEYVDVRLDELLYHTSGLPADVTKTPSWPTLRNSSAPLTEQRRQWAGELLALAPESSRGTHRYSNGGYVVAGAMLEAVTGERWEDLMQRNVFTPLGMASTGFGPPGTVGAAPDEPRGHVRENSKWVALQPNRAADNPAAIGPAGTVHSTVADFARYMAAHLAGARGEGGIVSAEAFRVLHTPAPGADYALGWAIDERSWAGGRVLQHSGSNTVWYARVWIAPERDFAMLAVTNAGGDDAEEGTDDAIRALIERFDAAFGGGG